MVIIQMKEEPTFVLIKNMMKLAKVNSQCEEKDFRKLQSTKVAYLLLTRKPRVQFLAFPIIFFLIRTVDSG